LTKGTGSGNLRRAIGEYWERFEKKGGNVITFCRIGLALNFIGTVMLCLSFGKNLEGACQTNKKGRDVFLASFLHPTLFRCGLVIIAAGFILQLIGQ